MTLARIAVHLDPAERDDFQLAARVLIAHGLVTDAHPSPGVLALVRRFEEPLRNEFARLCHWRLDVGPAAARLLRRPAAVSPHRPARTATQSRRPLGPRAYASLCLVLAALERLGEQTTLSQLADEIARLRAGDESLPFDLTAHAHRRAFVDAAGWLQQRGILTLLDGDAETFLAGAGDALYDVDHDAASRLLVSPPSVLAGLSSPDDFLDEPYPPTPEGAAARVRHRVHRRLLTEPALYYDELPAEEREYARQRRTRIRDDLERLTGASLEGRAEGLALVGMPAAEAFPGAGAIAQAALLLGGELVTEATSGVGAPGDADRMAMPTATPAPHDPAVVAATAAPLPPAAVGCLVGSDRIHAAWRRVVAAYGGRFTTEYRAEPDRLCTEALALLTRLDLVRSADGGVLVRPALARYRPQAHLPETLGV